MKSAAIRAGLTALALASVVSQDTAQAKDHFAEACQALDTGVQKERNVCVIGVAEKDSKVRVLYSTNPAMRGKVVAVFRSPIIQGSLVPLEEVSTNEGELVAVGGVDNTDSIFSAKFLEAAGPWFAAAIEALTR